MSVAKPALVVLAAGMGSRYGGLKQIDSVGPSGETLLDYSIFDAVRGGFAKVVFVIREDIEAAFIDSVGANYEGRDELTVRYAFQELDDVPEGLGVPAGREKPWGTGHATLAARDQIDEPFAVINADDFYGARAFELLGAHLIEVAGAGDAAAGDYSMVGFVLRDTLSDHGPVVRGVCEQRDGYLWHIDELRNITRHGDGAVYPGDGGEDRHLTGDETVSMNFWGFTPAIFAHLESGLSGFLVENLDDPGSEFLLPDLVDNLISTGAARVRILPDGGPWFGVTYREDSKGVSRSIRSLIDAGDYPERLWG